MHAAFSFEMAGSFEGSVSVSMPMEVKIVTLLGGMVAPVPVSQYTAGSPTLTAELKADVSVAASIRFGLEAVAFAVISIGASLEATAKGSGTLVPASGGIDVEASVDALLSGGLQLPDLNPPDFNICGIPLFDFPKIPVPSFGFSIPIPIASWKFKGDVKLIQAFQKPAETPAAKATKAKAKLPPVCEQTWKLATDRASPGSPAAPTLSS